MGKINGVFEKLPDGRMLAAAHYIYDYTEITDFNTATGAITNPRKLYLVLREQYPQYKTEIMVLNFHLIQGFCMFLPIITFLMILLLFTNLI
jgi:hypothetical protein